MACSGSPPASCCPSPSSASTPTLRRSTCGRAYHRLGLGSKLVGVTAAALVAQRAASMIVWVIAANKPARDFYAALGAELVVEQPFQWDGMDLVEAGYGWRDLPALVARCNAVTLH